MVPFSLVARPLFNVPVFENVLTVKFLFVMPVLFFIWVIVTEKIIYACTNMLLKFSLFFCSYVLLSLRSAVHRTTGYY